MYLPSPYGVDKNTLIKSIAFSFPTIPLGIIVVNDDYFVTVSIKKNDIIQNLLKNNMKNIEKYLDDGYYVILDRYTTSNLAHQGSKIHDKDERFNMYQWIDKLEFWLLGLPKPDKTIFLHILSLPKQDL